MKAMLVVILALAGVGCSKEPEPAVSVTPIQQESPCPVTISVSLKGSRYTITGKNSCDWFADSMVIGLKFYNSANERIGRDAVGVGSLHPGEKFRHSFRVPQDVLDQGTPMRIDVDPDERYQLVGLQGEYPYYPAFYGPWMHGEGTVPRAPKNWVGWPSANSGVRP